MSPILGIYASQISGHLFAPSGAYDSIATTTLGSAQSSITFSSIPSTYTHLQIRMLANMNADINIRFNGDTSSTYPYHFLYGAGSTPVSGADNVKTFGYLGYGGFSGSTAFSAIVTDVLDYTSTSKKKTIRTLMGNDGNTVGGGIMLASSFWDTTPAAINSITIFSNGGANFGTNSSFALYGIKGN